jgi:CDP-diacylglycerol--glycerol-3-phosphate 3-phosphatidyltransferase
VARPAPYDEYLAAWSALHAFEPERVRGVLRAYLRLPYAVATRLRFLHPNAVTAAGLLLALATVPPYAWGRPWLALPVVLLAGLADSVDGCVAAITGRATAFGAVLDSTVDRVADLALLAGPALVAPEAAVAAGAGTFLLEYVRARCQVVGHTARQRVTPGERPFRVVATALLAPGGATAWRYGGWVMAAVTALSAALLLYDARARPTRPASG